MTDTHIHLERGPYTLEWVGQFVNTAQKTGLDEIWLLEHCYRFSEFVPMYDRILGRSEFIDNWFSEKSGVLRLSDYLGLIEKVRGQSFPVRIRFGLEVCYFEGEEEFVFNATKGKGFDFLLGSVHFIDGFAFDHKAEHWCGIDVDSAYRTYFRSSVNLAKSGLFDGIAHPDSIKLFGHTPSVPLDESYDALAKALSESRMYAEENSGTSRRCPETSPLGMDAALLCAMKRHGVRIMTASDTHCPEDVGDKIAEMEIIIQQ